MTIESIGSGNEATRHVRTDEPGDGSSFAKTITSAIRDANADQVEAADRIRNLAVDGEGSIHEAMVAMSNAEGSFRLMMEIRNRIVQGVNELLQTGR